MNSIIKAFLIFICITSALYAHIPTGRYSLNCGWKPKEVHPSILMENPNGWYSLGINAVSVTLNTSDEYNEGITNVSLISPMFLASLYATALLGGGSAQGCILPSSDTNIYRRIFYYIQMAVSAVYAGSNGEVELYPFGFDSTLTRFIQPAFFLATQTDFYLGNKNCWWRFSPTAGLALEFWPGYQHQGSTVITLQAGISKQWDLVRKTMFSKQPTAFFGLRVGVKIN